MRADKQERLDRLIELIQQTITENPFEYDGLLWARFTQAELAEATGYSLATIERLITEPSIHRLCIKDPETGRKVTLLRVGAKVRTETDLVRIMADLARKAGANVERRHFGMLRALVQELPEGYQIAIVSHALSEWPALMAGVHLRVEELKEAGEAAVKRYYKFPSVDVLVRFRVVAIALYLAELQAAGDIKTLAKIAPTQVPKGMAA